MTLKRLLYDLSYFIYRVESSLFSGLKNKIGTNLVSFELDVIGRRIYKLV